MRSIWKPAVIIALSTSAVLAQSSQDVPQKDSSAPRRSIVSISICAIGNSGPQGTCPSGSFDTFRRVLAPDGVTTIDDYAGLGTLSDEHATVFSPGTIPGHANDYLFFVATRTNLNPLASGLTVFTGGPGPDAQGQWTFDFASDFGLYQPGNPAGSTNGQVFLAAMAHDLCPTVGNAKFQDQTFDLNYADPGTVFIDPTSWGLPGRGNMLMIYEGTSRCVGLAGGTSSSNFYSTIGVATSFDFGHTWPTYRRNFVALPNLNQTNGPEAPLGALGDGVCFGNDCHERPPFNFGRYAVQNTPVTLGEAMADTAGTPGGLQKNMGNSEPSAFVDDVSFGPDRYVYTVTGYAPGTPGLGAPYSNPQLQSGIVSDLVVSRAKLNGGLAPLQFMNWYNGSFNETEVLPSGVNCNSWEYCRTMSNKGLGNFGGGLQTPILPFLDTKDAYTSCQDINNQSRVMGSISYVEDTQQYLLLFVCISHLDPTAPKKQAALGAAWFYSTLDATGDGLSDQSQWSQPQIITGSWNVFPAQINPLNPGCALDNKGWYPTIMSLGTKPGHLSSTGFIFYMDGCTDSETFGGRKYESRAFTITLN
jgi:hypothetical protein